MKTILKTALFGLCILLFFALTPRVSAWFIVNKHLEITLVDIEEPYWFDLLYYSDSVPETLSDPALDDLLPEDYLSTVYTQTMNGFQDSDGYISFRLYSAEPYSFLNNPFGRFEIGYEYDGAFSFKFAIIYPDGTIEESAVLTQTKAVAIVTYENSLVQFEEFDEMDWECCDWTVDIIRYRIRTMLMIAGMAVVSIALQLLALHLFGYRTKKVTITFGIVHAAELLVLLGWIYIGILRNEHLVPLLALIAIPICTIIEAVIFTRNVHEPIPFRAIGFVILANIITVVFLFSITIFI